METFSCLQEGDFNLGVFAGVPQLARLGFACIRGFSLVSLQSMISSCYFFVTCVIYLDALNLIWLTFVVQERGRIGFHGQIVLHISFLKSSQIDRDSIDHHHQGIDKIFQVRSIG